VTIGPHRVIVKEVLPRGLGRRLADALRGSAGRRAWLAGHGIAARGLGVATPLAFLERRVLGLPMSSLVVLEDLRPAVPADVVEGDTARLERTVEILGDFVASLHERGVDHGDLKASHIHLDAELARPPRLIDLEGVRFGRRIGARRRRRALAQLNASLPELSDVADLVDAQPKFTLDVDGDIVEAKAKLTRYGGDCYIYAMLAMGMVDLATDSGLNAYDIQALMPIIRGAGGVVTTVDGGDASMGGFVVAAGDARLHELALRQMAGEG